MDQVNKPSSASILNAYMSIIRSDVPAIEIGHTIPIPRFTQECLIKLCEEATQVLKKNPNVLKLHTDIYIVGDLHGNIRDLIRILRQTGTPPTHTILFLGDFVDRGDFSIEVISLLLALMVNYSDNVFLLRGNHEFPEVNCQYGFQQSINETYPSSDLWYKFQHVFSWLSLAALVDDHTLCVHGGLSKYLNSVEDIDQIIRPVFSASDELISDLVWSDPSMDEVEYGPSDRGNGCHYGVTAVEKFLAYNKLLRIIRAHQCVTTGYHEFAEGKVITVFSSSNYCDRDYNLSCYIFIKHDGEILPFSFQPLGKFKRPDACFYDCHSHLHSDVISFTNCKALATSISRIMPTGINKRRSVPCVLPMVENFHNHTAATTRRKIIAKRPAMEFPNGKIASFNSAGDIEFMKRRPTPRSAKPSVLQT